MLSLSSGSITPRMTLRTLHGEEQFKGDAVDAYQLEVEDFARAVTFEVYYSNADGALSADEVNAATGALVSAVLEQFGPRGVRQR